MRRHRTSPQSVIAQCPSCGLVQSITLLGSKMEPDRKFYQKGGVIWHNCYIGSPRPCQLFGMWESLKGGRNGNKMG